jgi:formylglycine-generating enzyme required for sulfatase activity
MHTASEETIAPSAPPHPDMLWVPGGTFRRSSDRYRPAARMAQPVDTSTSHLGFRCIVRPKP